MSQIASRLKSYVDNLPPQVRLAAVSKFHTTDEILEAYQAGQRLFAESRVQELTAKVEHLPADVEWHFIGPLQTNKVKYLAPFVSLIHSVDSMRLYREIDKQAKRVGRTIPILLQVYIADEDTKSGFSPDELIEALKEIFEKHGDASVQICGLMGMATYTDDKEQIRAEFAVLKKLFEEVKAKFFPHDENFTEISMGMSGDYQIAIEEGSTLIRIGTAIFGERSY